MFQKLLSSKGLKAALDRIKKAIEKKESIVVFGDYDCDGVCGTADVCVFNSGAVDGQYLIVGAAGDISSGENLTVEHGFCTVDTP